MKDRIFKIVLFSLFITILFLISAPIMKMLLSLSPELIKYITENKEILNSIFFTFKSSLFATLAGVIFGVPTAYILTRYNFPFKNIIESLIDIPVMFPHSAAGIAL